MNNEQITHAINEVSKKIIDYYGDAYYTKSRKTRKQICIQAMKFYLDALDAN